jgi:hypothetical protein
MEVALVEQPGGVICVSELLELEVELRQSDVVVPQTSIGVGQFLPGQNVLEGAGEMRRDEESHVILDLLEAVGLV